MFPRKIAQVLRRQFILLNVIRNYANIGVIGAPFDKGQRKAGVALGPKALRHAGLLTHLQSIGCCVHDYGDVPYEAKYKDANFKNVIRMRDVIEFNKELSSHVSRIIKDGRLCLTIGGDHSVGIGTVHGHLKAQPETSVLWIDAHADINTPATSLSGNAHGMPMSFSIKELKDYHSDIPGFEWHSPLVSARHVAFIGLRDVDPLEKLIINKLGICAVSMEEVHEMGTKEAIRYALSRIDPDNRRFLHVSFDIDALDPLEAPSTGTPVRGGLTLREGMELLRSAHQTGRLTAVDIAEINPLLGSPTDVQITLDAARHLVTAASGYYLGGCAPKDVIDIPKY